MTAIPRSGTAAAAVLLFASLTGAAAQSRAVLPGAAAAPASGEPAVVRKGLAPVSDAPLRVRLPVPTTFDLANGLHVLVLEERRAAQVSFHLVIPGAGGYFDPPDLPGLAVFTAAMLREGTTTRTSEALARELEMMAAAFDVTATAASPDAEITGSCLTEHAGRMFELLADVLVNATLPEDELRRYQQRAAGALAQQRAAAYFPAAELFARLVNGDHPAARTSPARDALVRATRARLVEFHRARYVPEHAALVVVGDLSAIAVKSLLSPAFSGWRATGSATPVVADPQAGRTGGVHLVGRPHSVQTNLVVGTPAIRRSDPDFYALQVMNQIIGAAPTGRLFLRLREEKGYTYGANSVLVAGRYRGSWSASTDVRADVTGPALTDLLAEIARLRDEPVPDVELRRQQRAMASGFALTLESPSQLTGYYVTQWVERLPQDYWDRYAQAIAAVSSGDVQRVARTYLDPSRMVIVAVGDAARIRDALGAFGTVQTHDSGASDTGP